MASIILEYQSLPIEKRFERYMKIRKKLYSFINEDNIELNVYSSFELIKAQMLKFDIEYAEKSIEDIYFQIKTKIEYFRERNENNIYKPILGKLHLIKDNILEIGFYSYDYNMSKMPEFLKAEFSHCQEYSNLLKEYKF